MGGAETVIVAGVGCARHCSAEEIVALVRLAATKANRAPKLLAAPVFKQDAPELVAAASTLGLALALVSEAALAAAQSGCVTRSARAAAATGFASVAEACALAAAGGDARLILPRIVGARSTCAIAEGA